MLQQRKKDCTGKAYLSLSVYLYLLVYGQGPLHTGRCHAFPADRLHNLSAVRRVDRLLLRWQDSKRNPLLHSSALKLRANACFTFCFLVSLAEFLKEPILVPNEVDNLVFQGKLKGKETEA